MQLGPGMLLLKWSERDREKDISPEPERLGAFFVHRIVIMNANTTNSGRWTWQDTLAMGMWYTYMFTTKPPP